MKQFLIVLIIAVFAIDSNEASEDTVVIDFTSFDNENPPSEGIKVPMQGDSKEAQSFCVRFYVESLNNQGIFSTSNTEFDLVLYLENNLGFFIINYDVSLIFPIVERPTPFVYQHLCFSHNFTHYVVAVEGKIWYISEFLDLNKQKLKDPIEFDEISFGTISYSAKTVKYFTGKISEFFIFSNSFSELELVELTQSCNRIAIGNKILDWSRVQPKDVSIPQGVLIKTEISNPQAICKKRLSTQKNLLPLSLTIAGK